jgi:hypothetical protein
MAFHLPTDLPTYLPTYLLGWAYIHSTFIHLVEYEFIRSTDFLSSAHLVESEFHSANFFSSAPSVESEFNQPTFSSACLFSWVWNHSANFSIYLTHLVESGIHSAQLFHLLTHLVESEIHSADFFICSLGWVWIHSADIFICSVSWVWIRFWADRVADCLVEFKFRVWADLAASSVEAETN